MENALIGALERAVVLANASIADGSAGSELLSKYVAEGLNALSKPADPQKRFLRCNFGFVRPSPMWHSSSQN